MVSTETRQLLQASNYRADRILWIDGVGGYLLLDLDEILVGQAVSGTQANIRIVGDLRRNSAAIRRIGGDFLWQPLQPCQLNGCSMEQTQLLKSGDEVTIGDRIQFRFVQPSPLSATARLEMVSRNQLKPRVDGVLLLSENCIIGPNPTAHVYCPGWTTELMLFKQNGAWFWRSQSSLEVNGQPMSGLIPLAAGMRIRGEDYSLSVE